MAIEKLRPAFTFTEDRLAELRAVVPEAFADGAVSWEALREALGAYLEDEGRDTEHFGLTWPGKRQARRLAAQPSKGTLIPAAGEGVDEATTRNLFIEGDNLEVLKLLQKSYAGRVKMIYIDPPYNTGNDFVYNDDYSEPLDSYLRLTGQSDEEGIALVTNTKAAGRFHSNWLSMMYPRLLLARQLLGNRGAVFVSIDDREFHNLRVLMNEIYGEENFVGSFIWQKMDSPSRNEADRAVTDYHEYIICYAKQKETAGLKKKTRPDIISGYKITLADGRMARRRQLRKNGKGARRVDRPTLWFPLEAPDGTEVYPYAPEGWEGRWVLSEETWREREREGLTEWIKRDYGWVPYYLEVAPNDPGSPWPTIVTEVDQNRQAAAKFTELMGQGVFDNPKPVNLLQQFIRMASSDDDICLDFFAGSGSFAHAVLECNRVDQGDRRFICVQLPEPVDKPDFDTIADIAKERIRRASKRLKSDASAKLDLEDRETPEDLGFRVYKLGRSNYKAWQDYQGESVEELETFFDRIETPLVDGWQREHVLAEAMLLQGFPLDSTVMDEQGFKRNRIQRVESDAVGHRLFVCLDDQIADETIAQIQLAAEDVFICLDSALTDEAKLRLGDRCTLRVI